MTYSIKAVKTLTGPEGYGYSCSLYLDNTKVADAEDAANGAPAKVCWAHKEHREADFKKWAVTQGEDIMHAGLAFKYTYGNWLSEQVNASLIKNELSVYVRRLLRYPHYVTPDGKVFRFRHPPSKWSAMKPNVKNTYRGKAERAGGRMLNDMTKEEATSIIVKTAERTYERQDKS